MQELSPPRAIGTGRPVAHLLPEAKDEKPQGEKMKTRMKDHNYIHPSSLRYIRLSTLEKDVLRDLLSYQAARKINPTQRLIAWHTGWSERSVRSALADLRDKELIDYEVWANGHPLRAGRPADVYVLIVENIRKLIREGRAEHDNLFVHPANELPAKMTYNSELP
jgi:hypothetical protein